MQNKKRRETSRLFHMKKPARRLVFFYERPKIRLIKDKVLNFRGFG